MATGGVAGLFSPSEAVVTPSSAFGAGAGVLLDPPVKKFEMLLKKPPELEELDELAAGGTGAANAV